MTLEEKETILESDNLDELDNLETEPDEDNSEAEPDVEESDEQATSEKTEEPEAKFEVPEKYKKFVSNLEEPTPQEIAIIKQFQEQDKFISKVTQEKSELQKKQESEKVEYEAKLLQAENSKLDLDLQEAYKVLRNEKTQVLQPYKEALIAGDISQAEYNVYEQQAESLYEQRKNIVDNAYVTKKQETETKNIEFRNKLINSEYQKFESNYSENLKLDENKYLYDAYKQKFGINANPSELPMIMEWAENYYKARYAREEKSRQLNKSKEQHKKALSNNNSTNIKDSNSSKHTIDDLLNDDKVFNKYF